MLLNCDNTSTQWATAVSCTKQTGNRTNFPRGYYITTFHIGTFNRKCSENVYTWTKVLPYIKMNNLS